MRLGKNVSQDKNDIYSKRRKTYCRENEKERSLILVTMNAVTEQL